MTGKAVFFRIVKVKPDAKPTALLRAINALRSATGTNQTFIVSVALFESIPSSPFAYWVPKTLLQSFRTHSKYELGNRTALQGASTCDDYRYVRAWFEVLPSNAAGRRWVSFAKGGRFSKYYSDVTAVVQWDPLRTTFHGFIGRSGRWNPKPVSADHYFQPGLTWPLRGTVFSATALPAGCAYSVGGKVALAPVADLPFLLGIFNSSIFNAAISLFAGKIGGFQYETGIINSAPIPDMDATQRGELGGLVRRAWSLKYKADTHNETSHAFVLPALLQVAGQSFADRYLALTKMQEDRACELKSIEHAIDEWCTQLYGISDDDRRAVQELDTLADISSIAEAPIEDGDTETLAYPDGNDEVADDPADPAGANAVCELLEWAIAVAFGRFDVRLATGVRSLSADPEPFDPLPSCSTGMLVGDDGILLKTPPSAYAIGFPEDGILVDDLGHVRDLATAVHGVFEVVFSGHVDAYWGEAAMLLHPGRQDLRVWLASSFFDVHLKRYTKSGRKAPIFWQLSIQSGRYSLWLYAHRLNRDTLFHVQNHLLSPKLILEERILLSLTQDAGPNPTGSTRNELAAQEELVENLRMMRDEVMRIAPLWNPALADGTIVTMAPLWRLVPHHRAWQRELKATWDALAAGKYDWAHLAMHLWPERVVPKCAEDRSLAIAHELEDVFWQENTNGKWNRRPAPTHAVEELVRERTSAAVKAALKNLMDAPVTGAAGGQGRSARNARGRGGR